MVSISMVLIVLAFVFFVLAAVGVTSRLNMVALGLALLTLNLMVNGGVFIR